MYPRASRGNRCKRAIGVSESFVEDQRGPRAECHGSKQQDGEESFFHRLKNIIPSPSIAVLTSVTTHPSPPALCVSSRRHDSSFCISSRKRTNPWTEENLAHESWIKLKAAP